MKSKITKIDRRQFLKLAGATTGVIAVPALLSYELWLEARGELPPSLSPYAPVDILERWPAQPEEASPILLLVNEQGDNPFGLYLGEILRAEGLNCFQIAELSRLSQAPLEWYDIVLLAEGPLTNSQVELLENYVVTGGRLVAMRPEPRLANLFGVEPVNGSTAEGYIQLDPAHPVGRGIAIETLQFHGRADHYRLAGAEAVAWLASAADRLSSYPALTWHRYNQGQAAVWAFDLARSIAYTRQGNPAWANQERDGGLGIRAVDMFKGWVDLDRLLIPQADEQQRLLTNLFVWLSQDARPLPRLWYFPGATDSVFIATGDSHIPPHSPVEEVLDRVERHNGHMSIYYSPSLAEVWRRSVSKARFWATDLPLMGSALAQQFHSITPSQVAGWRARGHEFALHPYVGQEGICAAYTRQGLATPNLEAGWHRYWQEFTGLGYGPVSPTVRTHCILWTGWVESARLQASYGMRLNLDYYHWGPGMQTEAGEWVYGHFTGSGLPIKFVDEQGRILNIYQQLTQLADDHWLDISYGGWAWGDQAKFKADAALEVSQSLLRHSIADHCAVVANFHPDLFYVQPSAVDEGSYATAAKWLEGTLDMAVAHNIPIWSAAEWLRFTEVRHNVDLEVGQWQPETKRLNFQISAARERNVELTVLVPLRHADSQLSQVEVDGLPVTFESRKVGGASYGCVSVEAGLHQVSVSYS